MAEKMPAHRLRPGQLFKVDKPDPEGPVRVCLSNDLTRGLRFGFPGNKAYWCYMGAEVPVELVHRCGTCQNCQYLERVRQRVLACCNPPFHHADQDVVDLWNDALNQFTCLHATSEEV